MDIQSLSRVKLVLAHLPWKILIVLFVLSLALAGFAIGPNGVAAQSPSNPSLFVGHWQAIDVDGSDIRLTIAGPAKGPFQVTWTESYFTFCNGEPGIARGSGRLVTIDVLTAQLRLVCFTTGDAIEFEVTWTYGAGTDTISSDFITWHHPGSNSQRCVSPPAGLTGWWPGDDGPNDLIGGRDGLFQGDATILSGLVDMAFALDGDGDFVEVPNASGIDFGPGNFTVDLWVNFNDVAGEQVLAEKWIQGDGFVDGWSLTKLDYQVLRLAIDAGNGEEADLDSDVLPLQPGKWYHVAATRQGAAYTLYLNGVPIAQNPEMGASNLSSPASLKFGHRGNPDDTPGSIDDREFYLKGRIDEVEIYVGTALSEAQIMALYQAGTAGKCKGDVEPVPELNLRVNYGHDWVESFYEAGHSVLIAVTEGDGQAIKATAQLVTEAKDFWDGETGFQTGPDDWDPAPPDIQPDDWVFGWVDNGASAQVQIGEINGMIDLAEDSIQGTINASWFADEVNVECFPWGSPEPQPEMKYDTVLPFGEEPYSCSWSGEWDIQPYQDVGVGYFGSDGHWVANAFFARAPRIVSSEAGDWVWTTDFNPGLLDLDFYESEVPDAALLWHGSREADEDGFVFVGYEDHGQDLLPGNYLVVSDGSTEKRLVLETITIAVFDADNEIMAGTAPAGREVLVVAGMAEPETQGTIVVVADPDSGDWSADFSSIGFDISEEMRPWSFAQIFDGDGDATEANPPMPPPIPHFVVFPEWEWFDGYDWPDGASVIITVDDKPECDLATVSWGGFFNGRFPEGCDLAVGDTVTFSASETIRTHVVQTLAVTGMDVDTDTVFGTADAEAIVNVWPHATGEQVSTITGSDGGWLADFSGLFDLVPGECGRAEIRDRGDYLWTGATAVDWCIPNPVIFAHPAYELIEGSDWMPGVEVTITVDDPSNGEGAEYTDTQIVGDDRWLHFWLTDFDLQAGHNIAMTDGFVTKTMVVSELRVTGFNLDEHTVYGIGDPNSEFFIADNGMPVLVDDQGNWSVALDELAPESWWTIIQRYEDGNEMRETFRAPLPVVFAHPAYDVIEGHEWTPFAEVTITIDDPTNGEGVDYTQTATASGNINYLYDTGVHFDLAFDLQAGHIIAMTDGQFTQRMVVSTLRVTGFNLDAHTVYGVGDPNSEFIVSDNGMIVPVDGDGNWSATIEGLLPGSWWTIIQRYEDGNEVRETFQAPTAG